ncbi:hypothetical protein SK128_009280 [Halocaridina rubra]|uniref:Uncharacterized protein n=1 Tax=Halocaridina rubra TaxID=373956 RepID=A0AAN9A0C6_HALRR
MVDSMSAEEKRKELLNISVCCNYPEDATGIKQRYKDTALILFKEQQNNDYDNKSYLSFGTRRSSTVSDYGNTPIIVRKSVSANGELSKVGEQWPSIKGRAFVSNYTLHETKERENEDEDTETDEDTQSKWNVGNDEGTGSVVVKSDQLENGETVAIAISNKGDIEGYDKQISSIDTNQGTGRSISKSCETSEEYMQENKNRKSFIHYDLHLQRPREFIDEDGGTEQGKNKGEDEEELDKENDEDNKDAESLRTVLEVEGVDHKILLLKSTSKKEHSCSEITPDWTESAHDLDSEHSNDIDVPSEESNLKHDIATKTDDKLEDSSNEIHPKELVLKETDDILESPVYITPDCPLSVKGTDEASIPVLSVSNSVCVINTSLAKPESGSDTNSSEFESSSDWSKVELKIIEPSDLVKVNYNAEMSKSATNFVSTATRILQGEDDDDDVVFIDDVSHVSDIVEASSKSDMDCSPETSKMQDITSPIPPKRRVKSPSESLPPVHPTMPLNDKCVNNGSLDEINNFLEEDGNSGLLALPVRSPTPPKRSPRRSPRVPKRKDKMHQRHSSAELESHPVEILQPVSCKVEKVPPPSSRNKLFNFSLKKERSKSVSSLNTKKNKDKIKVPTRSESEDIAVNSFNSPVSRDDDSAFESSGKRVGVRSLVIDGTIKRNFIVIHPSDDSDTIGLAPLSSFSGNERISLRASKVLSTVKSHISGKPDVSKKEEMRLSSKQEIKRESTKTSQDVQNRDCLNANTNFGESSSKNSDLEQNDKPCDSHLHQSSVSLSSMVSHVNTKVHLGSSGGLSQIDCNAAVSSTQGITLSSKGTTSRLCVVM